MGLDEGTCFSLNMSGPNNAWVLKWMNGALFPLFFYLMHISFPVIGILVCMRNIQIAGAIESLELGSTG